MSGLYKIKNVLCTSCGNDGFPSVYEGIKNGSGEQIKIIGVDVRENATGLFIADRGIKVTYRNDPNHINELLGIIAKYKISVLFPLSTEDQLFYSFHRAKFPIPIITSKYESLIIANNKFNLFEFLRHKGMDNIIPQYYKIKNTVELFHLAQKLGYPTRKVVFKLDSGTGAQGLKIVDDSVSKRSRLLDKLNLYVTLKELTYLLEDRESFPESHLVEFLENKEYSVDVLCRDGEAISIVVRRRDASIFGLATDSTVIFDEEIEECAKNIIKAINLDYVINIQFKKDRDERLKLMEINPRIPGTIGLTIAAGINMPYLALKLLNNSNLQIPKPALGTRILRKWDGIYIKTKS